jgi:hypothetical protein
MGCEMKALPGRILDSDGKEEAVRFLYNPEEEVGVPITGFDSDDEFMSPYEVANLERRLQLEIPKPWPARPFDPSQNPGFEDG